jgi:hypothetical protein
MRVTSFTISDLDLRVGRFLSLNARGPAEVRKLRNEEQNTIDFEIQELWI